MGICRLCRTSLLAFKTTRGKHLTFRTAIFKCLRNLPHKTFPTKPSPQSLHWLYRNLQAGGNKTGRGRTFVEALIQPVLTRYMGLFWFIYLFGVLHRFQHCTGHITTGSWKGRGNQYIQLVSRFCTVNCRPTASNYQLSHLRPCWEPNPGLRGGRQVLPLCHRGPRVSFESHKNKII